MFCGNHDAAENAAIMYSLLGCCAASDVNPRKWLTDVLTRIPYYNNDYSLDLADLLPHNWKAARELQKISNGNPMITGYHWKKSNCPNIF